MHRGAIETVLSRILMALSVLAGGGVVHGDAPPTRVGEAYPLGVCAVSGNPLGEGMVVVVLSDMPSETLEGREVRFCCEGCVARFKADPMAAARKLDEMIIADQLSVYPDGTCIVMENERMFDPRGPKADRDINRVLGNRLYRFCCKACIRRFKKAPEPYVTLLDERITQAQSKGYPLSVCVISGRPLGDAPVEVVVANRLVRTCCKDCATSVRSNPAPAIAKLGGKEPDDHPAEAEGTEGA